MNSIPSDQAVNPDNQELFGLPLNRETLFSNHKGKYKKGIEKRQIKFLKEVSFLKRFLQKDEKILLITTGCSPTSILEQLLTGWIFVYLKRSLLVFTNKRIFHIPTNQNFSYRNSIARILYSDCDSIQMKGRYLIIEYKNGHKEKFLYIAGKEKKKIKVLIPTISLEGGAPSQTQQRVHLCPACTNELEEDKYSCPNCNLEFKDKEKAKKIAIIYPGGGYFYTRHPFLGITDAIVEISLIVLVITSLIDVINGLEGGEIIFFFYAFLLVVEKSISVYHSNHFVNEYIPVEKEITTIPSH